MCTGTTKHANTQVIRSIPLTVGFFQVLDFPIRVFFSRLCAPYLLYPFFIVHTICNFSTLLTSFYKFDPAGIWESSSRFPIILYQKALTGVLVCTVFLIAATDVLFYLPLPVKLSQLGAFCL